MRRRATAASPAYLERVAVWYLERFSGSVDRVRRALEKRVRRSVEELGTDPREGAEAVERVLAKLTRMGLLDDQRLAASRVRALRLRGKSARAIRASLRRQGIDEEMVDQALDSDEADELEAARVFARKRRLGSYRDPATRAEHREKDLAKMARAGYRFDVARQVLDAD